MVGFLLINVIHLKLLGLFSLRIVPTFMALACALLSLVGTMDRICSGGAGKNGSTIAVSRQSKQFSVDSLTMIHITFRAQA